MKNDQFWEKCNNGQVLMAYASWQTDSINDWSPCSIDGSSSMEQGFLFFSDDGYFSILPTPKGS